MYCDKCGNELKEDAQFCRKCGTKLSDNDTAQQTQSDSANAENLFDVELQIVGDENKLEVIKVLRELTGLGLTEAKNMVDKTPVIFKRAVHKTEAETIKANFLKVGALVTLKEHGKSQEPIPKSTSTAEPHGTGIFCPKCHSYDLDETSETETKVSGGGYGFGSGCCGWILLGPIGLLCGFCGRGVKSSSTTRELWKCNSCGHKFRDPEDEYGEYLGVGAISLIACIAALIAGIVFAAMDIDFFWIPSWVYITAGVIGTGLSIFALYYINKEYKKKTESDHGIIPKDTVFLILKIFAVLIGGLAGVIICVIMTAHFMSYGNQNIIAACLMLLLTIAVAVGTFIGFFKIIRNNNRKNK